MNISFWPDGVRRKFFMKEPKFFSQALLTVILAAALAGCAKKEEAQREEKPPPPKNTVTLDEDKQKQMELGTEALAAAQLSPQITAYGRVVDPAALAAVVGDFTTARAANDASQAELKRLRTLAAQSNASERALQAAEAAAARDQAQFESARLKLLATWGDAIAGRDDLPAFVQSLGKMEAALVRIDLPAGQTLKETPNKARLVTLSGAAMDAAFLGETPMVDPRTQSREFLFLAQPNSLKLAPGAAVTGYLQIAGEPLSGVVIPRSAIIRQEGETWVYFKPNATNFVRRVVALEYPLENGWFVSRGVAAGETIVVTGAQTVFSQELNSGGGFQSGARD
jgi:type IV pilus biogenesis protein CpaD/CtpE